MTKILITFSTLFIAGVVFAQNVEWSIIILLILLAAMLIWHKNEQPEKEVYLVEHIPEEPQFIESEKQSQIWDDFKTGKLVEMYVERNENQAV